MISSWDTNLWIIAVISACVTSSALPSVRWSSHYLDTLHRNALQPNIGTSSSSAVMQYDTMASKEETPRSENDREIGIYHIVTTRPATQKPSPITKQTSTTTAERRRDSDIVFPTDADRPFMPPGQPMCAAGTTFCEDVDGYPTLHIEQTINREAQKYSALFGDDFVAPKGIENRFNGFGEEQLCESEEELIYPKVGVTNENSWQYIVNLSNYKQGIRIEKCRSNNTTCNWTANFPQSYRSECRQKHIYRQLLAIDKNGNTKKDLFQMPSCCQCVLLPIDRS